MSNLSKAKNLYILVGDNGVSGVYTNEKSALEAANSEAGEVLHVVPVKFLNQQLGLTDYIPPTLPTLTYGPPSEGLAVEEDYQYDAEGEEYDEEAQYDEEGYPIIRRTSYRPGTPEVEIPAAAPKPAPQTAKDKILAKLQSDLDVEDEAPAPTGGTMVFHEGRASSTSTGAAVEVFSPV
jgi:hypothetical protein